MSPAILRVGLGFALTMATASAWAQGATGPAQPSDPLAQARDEARHLAERALTILDSDPAKARALFEQAEAKFHAPTHLLYLAQALTALGDLEAAARTYQKLGDEVLPGYAPDAFRQAQRIGRDELAALVPELARVRVSIGAEGIPASYQVDGLPVEVFGGELLLAPGRRVVRASTSSGASTRTVVAVAGGVLDLKFELAPKALAPESPDHTLLYVGVTGLAVGGVALTVGAITGVLSLVDVDQLSDRCPTKVHCDPADSDLADAARAKGNASTALWVVGGVSAAAGTVMVVIHATGTSDAVPAKKLEVSPVLGLGYVGLKGRF